MPLQENEMKKRILIVLAMIPVVAAAVLAVTQLSNRSFRESLSGFEEVPVVSTEADGRFRARIGSNDTQVTYELSYDGLEGAVTQAHIHLGQEDVNGAVIVWLCGNNPPTSPPPGTPPCPPSPATV